MKYYVLYDPSKLLSAAISDNDEFVEVHEALIGTDLADMEHMMFVMQREEPSGHWTLTECEEES